MTRLVTAWFAGRPFGLSRFAASSRNPQSHPLLDWTRMSLRATDCDELMVGSEAALWILWGGSCFEFPHARLVSSTAIGEAARGLVFVHPGSARRKRLVHTCQALVGRWLGRVCLACGIPFRARELLPPRLRSELRAWDLGVLGDATAVGADWFEVLLDAAEDGRPDSALGALVAKGYKLVDRPTLCDVSPRVRVVIERSPGARSASVVEIIARQTIGRSRGRAHSGVFNLDHAFRNQLRPMRGNVIKRCSACNDRWGQLRHDGTRAVAQVCRCTSLWPDVFEFEVA